jgi:hypothetical protein
MASPQHGTVTADSDKQVEVFIFDAVAQTFLEK